MAVKVESSSSKKAAKKPVSKAAPKKAVKAEVVAPKAKDVEKTEIKRVPPRIIRKPPAISKPASKPVEFGGNSKAIAFAMSIAEEMKRSARSEDESRRGQEIRLSTRPTTRARGQNTDQFPAADLKEFRKRLLAAREEALSGIDAMKATGFNESGDHEADGGDGTNQTLRLQALGQMGNIHRTIQQIEEALHRIEDGTYGVCTVCGQLIRKPRLLNQPFVLTCMECQCEMERNRG